MAIIICKVRIPLKRLVPGARLILNFFFLLTIALPLTAIHAAGGCVNVKRSFRHYESAQPLTQQPTADMEVLNLGQPISREITAGQAQQFQINLSAGQFARVVIQQHAVDVAEEVLAPDGKSIASFDEELRPEKEERAEFVAQASGVYRIEVKAKFRGALGRYEIRLAEARAATDHDRVLHEIHQLEMQSVKLMREGKYHDAVPLGERALGLAEKELGPDDPYIGTLLNEVGELYLDKGAYAKALAIYERALTNNQKALGLEHPEAVDSMLGLGATHGALNEFQKSEELLQQALLITRKTFDSNHPRFGQCLLSLANLDIRRKDFARAEQEFQQVIEIGEKRLTPDNFLSLQALNNLGVLYNSQKEYERAEPLLQRALEIRERLSPDSPELAMPLQNLGLIAQEKRKDYVRALELYWRAAQILEKGIGPETPRVAAILNNIANIYKTQGDYAKSLELHKRVYSIFEESLGPHHSSTLVSLGNIARTYAAMGDVQNSVKFQTFTDETIEKSLTLNLAIGSERQKLAFFEALSDRTDRTISLHINLAPGDAAARDLAALVILQRKGRVLDAMSQTLSALRQRLNSDDQKLLDELNSTTAQLAKLELSGRGQMPLDDFRKQVATLEEQKEKLESEISRRSTEFRAQTQPVTLAAVLAAIPHEGALIEFATYRPFNPRLDNLDAYGEPHYVAYIMRAGVELKWKELGPAKDIDAAIEAFRQSLSDPQHSDLQQRARAVDEKVMHPLRALLGDATQLLVSADGSLSLIPFSALVDEKGEYLIERYSISYLTSGRDLLRLQLPRSSTNSPVIVADPTFGEPVPSQANNGTRANAREGDFSTIFFGPLPGVADEVRALKALLPEARFLTRESATKAAIQNLSAPSILHIATHGFFLSSPSTAPSGSASVPRDANSRIDNPLLLSGLALAGANQNSGGILTALEASGLNLWGTKLVVLSACDTGIGRVTRSEGVYGLRRSLLLAGAESQVMSLWPVSDRSTRDLIASYYRALLSGAGRGEALRQAQLEMLKSRPHRHPYYWAGFIQTGAWTSLSDKR